QSLPDASLQLDQAASIQRRVTTCGGRRKTQPTVRDGLTTTSRLLEVWDLARALDLAPNQYVAKYEPEFGPIAYEDIIDLTEHIRRAFPEVTSKNPSL
ncbi:hypothetical protein, partial [Pseudomonas aeruginosa]|uniref:hypothetical protein n=3 Tax=Pseudomonas TaxID=286 RepID=UPI001E450846